METKLNKTDNGNGTMALTNVSFDFLSGSAEFLRLIVNNISSCILILDKDVRLAAFNDAVRTIFSNHKDEDLLYRRCGEAIGCAYQIEEMKDCGNTSKCYNCDLRISALTSYMNNENIYKEHIVKPFFNFKNQRLDKHLQFSTRVFYYKEDKYIIMIIDDITRLI